MHCGVPFVGGPASAPDAKLDLCEFVSIAWEVLKMFQNHCTHHNLVGEIDIAGVGPTVVEERCHLQDLEQVESHEGALEQITHATVLGVGNQAVDGAEKNDKICKLKELVQ